MARRFKNNQSKYREISNLPKDAMKVIDFSLKFFSLHTTDGKTAQKIFYTYLGRNSKALQEYEVVVYKKDKTNYVISKN
jgi:hypothetical protein